MPCELPAQGRSTPHASPKILLIISTLSAGGAERVASVMVNHWAASRLPVGLLTLLASDMDHYVIDSRVQRICIDIGWPSTTLWRTLVSTIRRCRLIRRSVRAFAPDVVISFIDRTNVLVLASLLGTRIPVVVSERVDPRMHGIGSAWSLARRILYPLASSVVVQTRAVEEWAEKIVPRWRVVTIPNCIAELPAVRDFSERSPIIVAVGRLVPQKGFDVLIRAFARSHACRAGWRLVILGTGPDLESLRRLADRERQRDRVEFPGVVDAPWEWLNRARVFALSSRFEGFPNALLEAMAMGCASIATDCPSGPGEIIVDERNGLLVPVDDVAALAAAIDRLADDPQFAEALAAEGAKARDTYAASRIMSAWDRLASSASKDPTDEPDRSRDRER